jgi:hypothetical protein
MFDNLTKLFIDTAFLKHKPLYSDDSLLLLAHTKFGHIQTQA